MARTKRSAATVASDENDPPVGATHGGPARYMAPVSSNKKRVHGADQGGSQSTSRGRSAQSRRKGKKPTTCFVPNPIDDPIPLPTADLLSIDGPDVQVLTLGSITFPDIDAHEADRKYWLQFHKIMSPSDRCLAQRKVPPRCEYPERAAAHLKELYDHWPPTTTDQPASNSAGGAQPHTGYVRREKDSKREWEQGLKDLKAATKSGAIPPRSDSDVLVFESIVQSQVLLSIPPALTPFLDDDSGKYIGFERAILVEMTKVLIQPIMHCRRPVVRHHVDTILRSESYSYVYDDPEFRTKPQYEWVTYTLPQLCDSSSDFDKVTLTSFFELMIDDPYHEAAKLAKPVSRMFRAPHRYPLPFTDIAIEPRTAWIVPVPNEVDGEVCDVEVFFTLSDHHHETALLLLKGICPEFMPYLRIVVRPVHGQLYTEKDAKGSYKYRWSVYLKTDVVDQVLRDASAKTAEQRAVIRDMLRTLGCAAGWITSSLEDVCPGPPRPWHRFDTLHRVHFPNINSVSDLHLHSLRDRVANPNLLDHVWTTVLPEEVDQRVLAWLLHRELPENRPVLDALIPKHSVRVKQPVVRLGSTGMFYEPLSGLFSDIMPSHVVTRMREDSVAPTNTAACADVFLQLLPFLPPKRTHALILSLIALTHMAAMPHHITRPPVPHDDHVPVSATLVLCPEADVEMWDDHANQAECDLSVIRVRDWNDFALVTLPQVQQAGVVVVSVDFVLKTYSQGLEVMAMGNLCRRPWDDEQNAMCFWTDCGTKRHCHETGAKHVDNTVATKTGLVNVASQADWQDAFASFGPRKHWNLFENEDEERLEILACPVLLHKLYWRRIVFDKVARTTNTVHEAQLSGLGLPVPAVYSHDGTRPTPLREFVAEASVTLLEPAVGHNMGLDIDQVFPMVALCQGDATPSDWSRRSQVEVVQAISLDMATCRGALK